MPPTIIRRATLDDIPVLREFEQGVIAAERPFDVTLKPDPIRYYDLEGMIAAAHIELVVAEAGGERVGSGYARLEAVEPYLRHTRHAYLGFMYVVPAHRGRGINAEIVEALSAWAAAQGVTELRLDVYQRNAPAIRAYEKAGFVQHVILMRRDG
jgi:GNAT superfamily N-acetyltransferase